MPPASGPDGQHAIGRASRPMAGVPLFLLFPPPLHFLSSRSEIQRGWPHPWRPEEVVAALPRVPSPVRAPPRVSTSSSSSLSVALFAHARDARRRHRDWVIFSRGGRSSSHSSAVVAAVGMSSGKINPFAFLFVFFDSRVWVSSFDSIQK